MASSDHFQLWAKIVFAHIFFTEIAMPIAQYHFAPLPGETNRAPRGGCWIAGDNVSYGTIHGFDGGDVHGTPYTNRIRPALFYPEGYWLPAGTTQYAKLFSATNQDRIVEYVPHNYVPRNVARLRAIQEANAARVPQLLAAGILEENEVAEYIRTRGLSAADLRQLERAGNGMQWVEDADNVQIGIGLREGESYIGRVAEVVFQIGTPPVLRLAMVQELWEDIQEALDDS